MSQSPVAPVRDLLDPPGDVDYSQVLTGPEQTPLRDMLGIMLAVAGFALVVPLLAQAILGLGWVLRGGGDFDAYRKAAMAYELPDGMVATQLALASLTVLACVLVRWLHGRRPAWLVSVWPGWRVRYLVICLLLAVVVLNVMLWLSFLALGMPTFSSPQAGWGWFLVALLVSSPLQAMGEEFFFRGYVLQALGSAFGNAWAGVVGSAVLFAIFHGAQNPALFAHRLCFGLVMGVLVVRVGGLEAAVAVHVANNVLAFGYALVTGGVAALKATTEITWAKSAFDIGAFALFAVAAWWIGRKLRVPTTTASV